MVNKLTVLESSSVLKNSGVFVRMISYLPLWETMKKRGLTTYDLIYKNGLSANTVHRIKNNNAITTKTLDELCFILNCKVSDIIEYVESDE